MVNDFEGGSYSILSQVVPALIDIAKIKECDKTKANFGNEFLQYATVYIKIL